jgi:hypothetical protein
MKYTNTTIVDVIGEPERLNFDDTLLEKLKVKTGHVDIEYPICGCGSTLFQLNNAENPATCMRKKKGKFVCSARTESEAVALGRKVVIKSIGDVLARQLANDETVVKMSLYWYHCMYKSYT